MLRFEIQSVLVHTRRNQLYYCTENKQNGFSQSFESFFKRLPKGFWYDQQRSTNRKIAFLFNWKCRKGKETGQLYIKDMDKKILWNEENQMKRWKKYVLQFSTPLCCIRLLIMTNWTKRRWGYFAENLCYKFFHFLKFALVIVCYNFTRLLNVHCAKHQSLKTMEKMKKQMMKYILKYTKR